MLNLTCKDYIFTYTKSQTQIYNMHVDITQYDKFNLQVIQVNIMQNETHKTSLLTFFLKKLKKFINLSDFTIKYIINYHFLKKKKKLNWYL